MSVAEQILALIHRRPGLTETELAETLFPEGPYQQRVNSTCRTLVKAGKLTRRGLGGPGDPYRYHLSAPPH